MPWSLNKWLITLMTAILQKKITCLAKHILDHFEIQVREREREIYPSMHHLITLVHAVLLQSTLRHQKDIVHLLYHLWNKQCINRNHKMKEKRNNEQYQICRSSIQYYQMIKWLKSKEVIENCRVLSSYLSSSSFFCSLFFKYSCLETFLKQSKKIKISICIIDKLWRFFFFFFFDGRKIMKIKDAWKTSKYSCISVMFI